MVRCMFKPLSPNGGLILTFRQANVMLAYPIPEAEELLQTKLSTAKQSLSNCEEDLEFLREQITVSVLSC